MSQATDVVHNEQASTERSGDPPGMRNSNEPLAPPSEWATLLERLKTRGPHEPTGWYRLIELAEASGERETITTSYDALLQAYPNNAGAQIAYLNYFQERNATREVQNLYKRFLRSSPSVDLWRHYLGHVRTLNTDPNTRDDVRQAYDFALNHVGQDKDSGTIWAEYLQFLKAAPTSTTWEEQQKMDALRKVYHRAVQIPLENVETLWSELEAFENGLNRVVAKKHMSDLMPSYMQARQVLRQLQRHTQPLVPPPSAPGRPTLALPAPPTFDQSDRSLVGAWKTYLKWEETNPLELEDKDKATLISRIQGVYRKSLVRMRFFGEIWYMAYAWTMSIGKKEEAIALLKQGIEANPSSFVLNFAYAEALELQPDFPAVHTLYANFLNVLREDLDATEARLANENTSSADSSQSSNTVAPSDPNASTATQPANTSGEGDGRSRKQPQELADRRSEYGLVYIIYMRFARRSDGEEGARAVFKKARTDKWVPWEVYEAAALMEYHGTKETKVASRIFQLGQKNFSDEVEFISHYLGFLISINDDMNARALFEGVINTFPADRARPLWEQWARYIYQYSDLTAALEMERRIGEIYPTEPPIKRFAQRHSTRKIDAIASRDLGVALARQSTSSSFGSGSLVRTETASSVLAGLNINQSTSNDGARSAPSGPTAERNKRPSSPATRGRDDSVHKRQRAHSPPPHSAPPPHVRDRDRGREGPPPRRRFQSPSFEREGGRDGHGPPRREREDAGEKPVTLPPIISWFVGTLPTPASFEGVGPVFRTDDLMQVFKNAVIPATGGGAGAGGGGTGGGTGAANYGRNDGPPPGGRGGGRPPPDYSPYQGPNSNPSGRGGRRR